MKKTKYRKAFAPLIVISVICVALMVVFPCLYISFQATIPEYEGTERVSEGVVPTTRQLKYSDAYDRVVIFGMDGAGAYFGEGVTPNFERIFANGSVTFEGIAQRPTSSGENWASMFTGLTVQDHKINNAVSTMFANTFSDTIFKVLHENNKRDTFFSCCNWSNINLGIIEYGCNVTKSYGKLLAPTDTTGVIVDEKVKDSVIERIQTHDDKVVFMQFDSIDHAGHASGYGSKGFVKNLITCDEYMGEIYDAYVARGWADTTLFICVSDHGHTLAGGHGGESDTEKHITFAVAGGLGNVIPGTPGKFVTQDLASVVLFGLGVKQPDSFKSKVPYNMFTTLAYI